jgi:hypothetical protein
MLKMTLQAEPSTWPPTDAIERPASEGVDLEQSASLPEWYKRLPPRVRRLAPPLTLAGLAISLLVHIVFLLLAAIWLVGGGIGDAGGSGAGGSAGVVGVATMTEQELGSISGGAVEDATPSVSDTSAGAVHVGEEQLPVETAAIGGTGSLTGALGDGMGGLGEGYGAGDLGSGQSLGGGSGGGGASFFGIEARGSRFAYICDISGSMDLGVGGDGQTRRIDILRGELDRSIRSLLDASKFNVVLFSTGSAALGDRHEWISASDTNKKWAHDAIMKIKADGATEPLPAFKIVFNLRPRPDAIYFMTDGEFDPANIAEIARLNAEFHIPIHCISFISREGEPLLKKITEQSGGTYKHFAGSGG